MWFLRRRSKALEEADKALQRAERAKQEIEASGAEVTIVSSALKELRERNHFAERMQGIIQRKEGPVHDT